MAQSTEPVFLPRSVTAAGCPGWRVTRATTPPAREHLTCLSPTQCVLRNSLNVCLSRAVQRGGHVRAGVRRVRVRLLPVARRRELRRREQPKGPNGRRGARGGGTLQTLNPYTPNPAP